MRRASLLLALALAAAACRPAGPERSPVFTRSELYFGRSAPSGEVSEAQWKAFVSEEVLPRLPAGFTVLDGEGRWRGVGGRRFRERSKVLLVLHDGGPAASKALEEIRARYKLRFQQESVLRVDVPADASF